jgi:hypothetical protein
MIITLLFVVLVMGAGAFVVDRLGTDWDPALRLGLSGLIGLGVAGYLVLLGLLPNGLGIAFTGVGLWTAFGAYRWVKDGAPKFRRPEGIQLIVPVVIGLGSLMSLLGVLVPSDALDWDTLAYHLAVPKIWLHAGQIVPIPYIHHSNFPFGVDNLHLLGLAWGGSPGAKAFQWSFYLLGVLAVFGFVRQSYGAKAGWWSSLAFATIPVALWEAGTAYVDVAHGLYGGIGILLAGRWASGRSRGDLVMAGLMLGFAAGSKFTGLQIAFCTGVALVLCDLVSRNSSSDVAQARQGGFYGALVLGGLTLLLAAPWLVKNVAWTGNPVYPFFYSKLGGSGWDQRRADIYQNEQQTFGVGRVREDPNYTSNPLSVSRLGHAILGLAYQPGRYVNPAQTQGLGTPLGAVGAVVVFALLAWLASGRMGSAEMVAVSSVVLSLVAWFFLSQQSRYLMPLAVVLAALAGAGVSRLRAGPILAGAICLQAALSFIVMYQLRAVQQLPVALGRISGEDYQLATVPFTEGARKLNEIVPATGKVALFDEVFGYLLDKPYFWANPGHTTLIPYDSMQTGADFANGLKAMGFTHVYASISPIVKDRQFVRRWLAAMGIAEGDAIPADERSALLANWEGKWQILLAEAVTSGDLRLVEPLRSGLIFEVN